MMRNRFCLDETSRVADKGRAGETKKARTIGKVASGLKIPGGSSGPRSPAWELGMNEVQKVTKRKHRSLGTVGGVKAAGLGGSAAPAARRR